MSEQFFFFKYHFNIFYFAHITITQALKLNFESDFSDFWGDFGDFLVISVISVNRLTANACFRSVSHSILSQLPKRVVSVQKVVSVFESGTSRRTHQTV